MYLESRQYASRSEGEFVVGCLAKLQSSPGFSSKTFNARQKTSNDLISMEDVLL